MNGGPDNEAFLFAAPGDGAQVTLNGSANPVANTISDFDAVDDVTLFLIDAFNASGQLADGPLNTDNFTVINVKHDGQNVNAGTTVSGTRQEYDAGHDSLILDSTGTLYYGANGAADGYTVIANVQGDPVAAGDVELVTSRCRRWKRPRDHVAVNPGASICASRAYPLRYAPLPNQPAAMTAPHRFRTPIPKIHNRVVFYAGRRIFREGDQARRAFVVDTGRVEISRERGGRKIVIGVIGPGGIFGEMALIRMGTRSATATARENTVCLAIPETVVEMKLQKADPFIRALLTMFVDTIHYLNDRGTEAKPKTDGRDESD